jgi:hypothetical protein
LIARAMRSPRSAFHCIVSPAFSPASIDAGRMCSLLKRPFHKWRGTQTRLDLKG